VGNTGKNINENMRSELKTFKKEVENNLLRIKNEWILVLLNSFLYNAPMPYGAQFSTGKFVNKTKLTIGATTQDLNLVNYRDLRTEYNNSLKTNDHGLSENSIQFMIMFQYLTENQAHVQKQVRFEVSSAYDQISLTNYLFYNMHVEELGWDSVPPYHTFSKTGRYSRRKLEEICKKNI